MWCLAVALCTSMQVSLRAHALNSWDSTAGVRYFWLAMPQSDYIRLRISAGLMGALYPVDFVSGVTAAQIGCSKASTIADSIKVFAHAVFRLHSLLSGMIASAVLGGMFGTSLMPCLSPPPFNVVRVPLACIFLARLRRTESRFASSICPVTAGHLLRGPGAAVSHSTGSAKCPQPVSGHIRRGDRFLAGTPRLLVCISPAAFGQTLLFAWLRMRLALGSSGFATQGWMVFRFCCCCRRVLACRPCRQMPQTMLSSK